MTRTLLLIDIQDDYFPGGAMPLVGPEEAAAAAARLLAAFRAAGEPVIHLQHRWEGPEATFMRPGTPGIEINAAVAPREGERVLTKEAPNGFLGTALEAELRADDPDEVVVAGMMSSMCVDATVRAAADLGFAVAVAHDACAAPDLRFGDEPIAGGTVHAAFMAALADGYARVEEADRLLDPDDGSGRG